MLGLDLARRAWEWFDSRTEFSRLIGPLIQFRVPPRTSWYSALGSMTLTAFLVSTVTGMLLGLLYVSGSGPAEASIRFISYTAPLGGVIRGMHWFSSSALIMLVAFHAIRVYLTGSYKFPRELNWVVGALLMFLVITNGFTGMVLRWNQAAVWSTLIGVGFAGRVPWIGHYLGYLILGGQTFGGATVSRMFAVHVFFVPALMFLLIGAHLYLVYANGLSERPEAGRPVEPKMYRNWYREMLNREGVPFWPEAGWAHVVGSFAVVATSLALGILWGAPKLGNPPDPAMLHGTTKPDWFLMWYESLVVLAPKGLYPYIFVGLPIAFFLLMVSFPFLFNKGERHPLRRPWAPASVLAACLIVGVLWLWDIRAPWVPRFDAPPLPASVVGTATGRIARGAALFHDKGCELCHAIAGYGGIRGPDLTNVANRLTMNQIQWRIINGSPTMPPYGPIMTGSELDDLMSFLETRKVPWGVSPASPSPPPK